MEFKWITEAIASDGAAQVIDRDHPDWQFWHDEFAHDALLSGDDPPALPTAPKPVEVPAVALAVSRASAAALLSVSPDTFERHVLPNIRVAQVGRLQLIPVRELENWLTAKSARALRG